MRWRHCWSSIDNQHWQWLAIHNFRALGILLESGHLGNEALRAVMAVANGKGHGLMTLEDLLAKTTASGQGTTELHIFCRAHKTLENHHTKDFSS